MLPEHDITPGSIHHCQVCGSKNLELVLDLGHQPLCISLLSPEQLHQPETSYPLRFYFCRDCSLAQIDYAVDPATVFYPDYPYLSGITPELATHLRSISTDVVPMFKVAKDDLVIDIGSNDGTLLSGFKAQGCRVLGVEPTKVALVSRKNGIDAVNAFFNSDVARDIVAENGQASVVTATNVFAHMMQLGEVMRGIDILLKDGGAFVSESHYLLNIVQEIQYDSIYHEHLRSYSLKSLITLFDYYGFTVVDACRVPSYGGSLRTYAVKGRNLPVSSNVSSLLQLEKDAGLHSGECYGEFSRRVAASKTQLLRLALDAYDEGKRFVGNSCPGRCTTLLNHVGIDRTLMPYIAEQPTSLKLGMFLPGKQIPVICNEILAKEQPDYVVLLAWHYGPAIAKHLRNLGVRSKLVMPLPEVSIISE